MIGSFFCRDGRHPYRGPRQSAPIEKFPLPRARRDPWKRSSALPALRCCSIRPWIRMNQYRFTGLHLAFFIFLVSNIGGVTLADGAAVVPRIFEGSSILRAPSTLLGCPGALLFAAVLLIFLFCRSPQFPPLPSRDARRNRSVGTVAFRRFAQRGINARDSRRVNSGAIWLARVDHDHRGRHRLSLDATSRLSGEPTHFAPIEKSAGFFSVFRDDGAGSRLHGTACARARFALRPAVLLVQPDCSRGMLDNAPTYLTFLAAARSVWRVSRSASRNRWPGSFTTTIIT